MLRVVENEGQIRGCQSALLDVVKVASSKIADHYVGFQGGTDYATVYYLRKYDIWMTLDERSDHYFNCVGLGDPFIHDAPAPVVEINVPMGYPSQRAGGFLVDSEGRNYLGHTGRVGGGKKGVSKANFMKYFKGYSFAWEGDTEEQMYVIGALDGSELIGHIKDFARISADFRESIKRGVLRYDGRNDDGFSPEFDGSVHYEVSRVIDANFEHGKIVLRLVEILEGQGWEVSNNKKMDVVAVRAKDGVAAVKLLFEVKRVFYESCG